MSTALVCVELIGDVNVTGAMLVVRACTDDLVSSGAGRIVNVASTEALAAGRRTGPYTVSKHALLGFTRTLAVDLGRFGVTANCVCPGATLTGMTAAIPGAGPRRVRPAPYPGRTLRDAGRDRVPDRQPDRSGRVVRQRRGRDRGRRHDRAGPLSHR
jgi:NAD(P)-dependent dehydrogenase (short-subunit alcohol dehydrogenase family)